MATRKTPAIAKREIAVEVSYPAEDEPGAREELVKVLFELLEARRERRDVRADGGGG